MRANGLQIPLGSGGDLADSLEVLVGAPAGGQGREGDVNDLCRGHLARSGRCLALRSQMKMGLMVKGSLRSTMKIESSGRRFFLPIPSALVSANHEIVVSEVIQAEGQSMLETYCLPLFLPGRENL